MQIYLVILVNVPGRNNLFLSYGQALILVIDLGKTFSLLIKLDLLLFDIILRYIMALRM